MFLHLQFLFVIGYYRRNCRIKGGIASGHGCRTRGCCVGNQLRRSCRFECIRGQYARRIRHWICCPIWLGWFEVRRIHSSLFWLNLLRFFDGCGNDYSPISQHSETSSDFFANVHTQFDDHYVEMLISRGTRAGKPHIPMRTSDEEISHPPTWRRLTSMEAHSMEPT